MSISPDNPSRFDRALVIINPTARSGRVATQMESVERAVRRCFDHVLVCPTEVRGHARRLAEHARDFDVVIAAGGDGTVHEIALGLADHDLRTPLAVIPLGTGNDFARMLAMPTTIIKAVEGIAGGTIASIDTGVVAWTESDNRRDRSFINAVGIGLDALTAHEATDTKNLPFKLGYTVAALKALRAWISPGVTVRDESSGSEVLYSGRLFFATVGNARDSGGGYTLTPNALLSDGLLDACIVSHMSRLRGVMMMPAARTGAHVSRPEVIYRQVTRLRLETDVGMPIHTDGEVCSLQARRIEVRVRRNSLFVVVPNADLAHL